MEYGRVDTVARCTDLLTLTPFGPMSLATAGSSLCHLLFETSSHSSRHQIIEPFGELNSDATWVSESTRQRGQIRNFSH